MWYVKKVEQAVSDVQAPRENIPPSINMIRQPIGLKNLGSTCALNNLIQMTFSFSPMQRGIMDYLIECETELAKVMDKMVTHLDDDEIAELSSLQLTNSLF